jgi:hypothetical protein
MEVRYVHRAKVLRLGILVAIVAGLTSLLTTPVAAYIGQSPYDVNLNGPSGTVPCSRDVTITASVRNVSNHKAVGGQVVKWSLTQSQSSRDRLSRSSGTTGGDGKTSVTLSFGSAQGARQVQATVAAFKYKLIVKCSGASGPGPAPAPKPPAPKPPAPKPVTHPAPRPTTLPATSTSLSAAGPAGSSGSDNAPLLILLGVGSGLFVFVRRAAQR